VSTILDEPEVHLLEQLRLNIAVSRGEFCAVLGIPPGVYRWHLRNKNAITSSILDLIYRAWGIDADQILLGDSVRPVSIDPEFSTTFSSRSAAVQSTLNRMAEALYALADMQGILNLSPARTVTDTNTPGLRFARYRGESGWSQRKILEVFHLGRDSLLDIEKGMRPIPEFVLRKAWKYWGVLPGNICHGFSRIPATGRVDIWMLTAALPPHLFRVIAHAARALDDEPARPAVEGSNPSL